MNEVNNRDKVFATKGHDNLRGQDKNNTSKNAILLLLLIDGILVAYFFTLLDSDQVQPVSDDDAALPDGETQPEIAALYFLDLDGRHPPLTSHDGETSTIPDLFLAEKNRLSTTDPPELGKTLTPPPFPDVATSPQPNIVSQNNPLDVPPVFTPDIDTPASEVTSTLTRPEDDPVDQRPINPSTKDQIEERDTPFEDPGERDIDPGDLVPDLDEILTVILIPLIAGDDGDGFLEGGAGSDVIIGDTGVDTISLGEGDDIILYDHDLHQSGTNHVDIVTDFSRGTNSGDADFDGGTTGGNDRIRLSNTTDAAAYLAIFDTLQIFPGKFQSGSTNDETIADTLIYRSHDDGTLTLAIVLEDYTEVITIDHFDLDAVPGIDRKPTKITLTPTSVSLDEGAIAADTTISTISVTDDGKGTNIPVIDGYISWARIGKATIKIGDDGHTLMLAAGSVLDYEDIPGGQITLTIKTSSTGIGLEPSPVTFTLTVNDVDERPSSMTLSPASWTLNDHTLASSAIMLTSVSFDDDALGTNTFSISDTDNFEIREGNEIWLKAKNHLDKASGPHTLTVTPTTTGTGEELAAQTFTLTIDKRPTGISYIGHEISFEEGRYSAQHVGTLTITDDGYGDVKPTLIFRAKGSFTNRLTTLEGQFEFRDTDSPLTKDLWLKENAFIDYEPTSDFIGEIEVFLNFDYAEGTTGIGAEISSRTEAITITDTALTLDVSVGTTEYPNIIQLPSAGLSAGFEIGSITTSGPMGQTITTTLVELDEDGNEFVENDRIFNLDDATIKLKVSHTSGTSHSLKFTTSTEGETNVVETINIDFNDIVVDATSRLYLGVENTDLQITLQNDNTPSTSEVDKTGDGDLIRPLATTTDIDTDNGTYSAVNGTGTYTPDTNFTGLDTFVIPVHDGRGGTGTKNIAVNVQKGAKDKRSFSTVRDDAPIQDPIHIAIARAIGVVELDSSIEEPDEYSLYKGEKKITDFVGNLFTGTYGEFNIRPNGQWNYDLDINNEEVNKLTGNNRMITDENSLKDTLDVEFRREFDDGSILRFGYVIEVTILGTTNITAEQRESRSINLGAPNNDDDYFLGMCATNIETVNGRNGDDVIDASHREASGGVEIFGKGGDDHIIGSQEDDLLDGGHGKNILFGNNGNDDFASASGEDVIDGGDGEDKYFSPAPHIFAVDNGNTLNVAILMDVTALKWRYDSYTGEWIEDVEGVDDGYTYDYVRLEFDFPDPYDDRYTYLKNVEKFEFTPVYDAHDTIITTGNYDDRINTGNYNDIVRAGGGNDSIIGGRGEDQLYGEDGNDDIEGKGGSDIIDGGPGDDTIRGGKGQDYITGGKGNDIIAGGGNGDVFHVYLGSHATGETNRHIVTDFHWETDSSTGKPTSDSDTVNIGDTRDDAVTAMTTLRFSNANYFELEDLAPNGVIPEKNVDDERTIKDILIFNTMGTASEADDILVMVLLDFVTDQVMDIDSTLFTHNLVA